VSAALSPSHSGARAPAREPGIWSGHDLELRRAH